MQPLLSAPVGHVIHHPLAIDAMDVPEHTRQRRAQRAYLPARASCSECDLTAMAMRMQCAWRYVVAFRTIMAYGKAAVVVVSICMC